MPDSIKFNFFKSHDLLKIRYAYIRTTEKNLKGIILLLHGRAEFIEKYKNIIHDLTQKGFDVATLDWRGQGLSARETMDRQKGYVKNFNDYLKDLKLFFDQVVKPENKKVYILAHSMGGHIGLRFLHDYPGNIDKAVLLSPMFDIKSFFLTRFVLRSITKFALVSGFSRNYIVGGKKYVSLKHNLKKNIFSHDPLKSDIQAHEIKKNPDLALGGLTWAWLNAAYDSIDIIMTQEYASRIYTPVLIINAQKDMLVKKSAQKKISSFLPLCEYLSIKNAYHEILFEKKEIIDIFWAKFEGFINCSQYKN